MSDNTHNCKNYETDGGDTLVIGGTLVIEAGAVISTDGTQSNAITKPITGTTIDAESRVAIDAIIDVLKALGLTK